MTLPHYGYKTEPVYESSFMIYFSIDKNNFLTHDVSVLDNEKIIFNHFYKSFEIINKHINDIIDVKLEIYDKTGKNIFYLKFNNFKFVGYLNFLNYSYNSNNIKFLEVKYEFTDIQYVSEKGLKQLRINKINDIFDIKDNDYIIKKDFLL